MSSTNYRKNDSLNKSWASSYDTIYYDVKEDLQFYLEQSQSVNGKVLELGCGTGRVTIPLALAGVDVSGIDISYSMIKKLREKCLNLGINLDSRVMDMSNLELPDTFDLVIIPFRGFQSLLTLDQQVNCLTSIRKVLGRGGRLILDIFAPQLEMFDQNSTVRYLAKEVTQPHQNATISVWHRTTFDKYRQTSATNLTVETVRDGVVIEAKDLRFDLRYLYPKEAQYLFTNCGYGIEHIYGGFKGEPLGRDSAEMVWTLKASETNHARF